MKSGCDDSRRISEHLLVVLRPRRLGWTDIHAWILFNTRGYPPLGSWAEYLASGCFLRQKTRSQGGKPSLSWASSL